MRLHYHVDENCKNMRDIVKALAPIHRYKGVEEVKLIIPRSNIWEETYFIDRDLFFINTAGSNNFLIRNSAMCLFPEPQDEAEKKDKRFINSQRYIDSFIELASFYSKDTEANLIEKTDKQVGDIFFRLLRKVSPEYFEEIFGVKADGNISKTDKERLALEADLTIDKPPHDIVDRVLINSYHLGTNFRGHLRRKHKDFDKIGRDCSDRENAALIKHSFETASDVEHIVITNDTRFRDNVLALIALHGHAGKSFALFSEDFRQSAITIGYAIQAEARHLSKDDPERENVRTALKNLSDAIKTELTQHSGMTYDNYVGLVTERQDGQGTTRL